MKTYCYVSVKKMLIYLQVDWIACLQKAVVLCFQNDKSKV